MSYGSGNQGGEGGGNVWSSGSHGGKFTQKTNKQRNKENFVLIFVLGSRGEFSRSYDNDNDGQGSRDR